jgi:hypothetical protein
VSARRATGGEDGFHLFVFFMFNFVAKIGRFWNIANVFDFFLSEL